MKSFEYFLENQEVKKAAPDINLAKSLVKDMIERARDAISLDISKFPKIIFENIYDSLRDFADVLLAIDGFKSYSHQASFAYLSKYGFEDSLLDVLDKFRYKRNSSKYYGQSISIDEAKEILNFYNRNKQKINILLKKKKIL